MAGWGWRALAGVLALTASLAAMAQAPQAAVRPLVVPALAAPNFTVYDSQNGLEEAAWNAVGVDARGVVWAGSDNTLAWFDGYRWHPVPLPVADSPARRMAAAPDGALWAEFFFAGPARYDGTRWVPLGNERKFTDFSLLETASGPQLWGYSNAILWRLHDGRWVDDSGDLARHDVKSGGLAQTRTLFGEPRQWVGDANGGLWYRRVEAVGHRPWQRFQHPAIDRLAARQLLVSRNDSGQEELWYLTFNSGLARIRADGVRSWKPGQDGLPSAALLVMAETRDADGQRDLWVGSRSGLLRLHGDDARIDRFDRRDGLPADVISDIKAQPLPDGSTALWLATAKGVARAVFGRTPWAVVSRMGEQSNGIFGVLVEPDGRGGERLFTSAPLVGVGVLENGSWRTISTVDPQRPEHLASDLWRLPGADGRLHRLLAMADGGLFEIDDRFALVPMAVPWAPSPNTYVRNVMARRVDGQVEWWVSVRNDGLYRLRAGRWTQFHGQGSATPWNPFSVVEQVDARGISWLWVATAKGLGRFDGRAWSLVSGVAGLSTGPDITLALVQNGDAQVLWIGSEHKGISRVDVTDPLHPRVLDPRGIPPPPNRMVYSVLSDSRGHVWVCTNRGVQRLTPDGRGGYQSQVFRQRDGLVNDECNLGSQFVDQHDRYWAGTMGGLGMYDPARETRAARPAGALLITALNVDGAARAFPTATASRLAPGDHRIVVDYTLLSGQREAETSYRSQLEGYESAFMPWSDERRRVFTNLPPGRYVLRIQARDFNGVVQSASAPAFVIAPYWWQRRWAQAALGLLAALGVVALVWGYNRRLRKRQQQLRRVVAEQTRELRDANARLISMSYLDPLTGIANRRRLNQVLEAEVPRAAAQGLPLGLIMVDIDHFKRYNDRHGHLAGDTALRAVAQVLVSAVRAGDLVARFGGEEFFCLMVDAQPAEVARVAERMRALVAALPPRAIGNDVETLTLSAGVLGVVPRADDRVEDLLEVTDAALYEAKNSGRNRVVHVGKPA